MDANGMNDDVDTASATETYVATAAQGGTDTVTVDFQAPGSSGSPVPIAEACGNVMVGSATTTTAPGFGTTTTTIMTATCGNGHVDPGEQCDGPDASACPGSCRPDCTCPQPFCTSSDQRGPTACCNPAKGLCCDFAKGPPDQANDRACAGGDVIFGQSLNCTYGPNGTTPYTDQPCGPMTPPTCPTDAQQPVWFVCSTCADTQKYVATLCNIDTESQDPSACRPATGNNP
jgi:hypothetical protein